MITPPVGINIFTVKSIAPDISVEDIFKGAGWFFVMNILTLAILVAFP